MMLMWRRWDDAYIDGLVQDCSNSIANALELLQSCTESPISLQIAILSDHGPHMER